MEKIDLNNKTTLVTGAAGFIGSNLVKRLFKDYKGMTIVGIDNMNDYYDPTLKEYRLQELDNCVPEGTVWKFVKGDIADKATIDGLFETYKPQVVVNLAAQAGVRYSITNPDAYIQSNMIGFYNIVYICKISAAVAIVEDLNGVTLQQLVRKPKICHVRTSGRTIDGKETQSCRWDIIQFRIAMCHQLVAFLGGSIQTHRIINSIIRRERHFLIAAIHTRR